jgi:putative transposase
MSNPFRYFNSSPEVIRLVVMMYVRYPLVAAQRRGSFGRAWDRHQPRDRPVLVEPVWADMMRAYPQLRWHLDEVIVKVNGKLALAA